MVDLMPYYIHIFKHFMSSVGPFQDVDKLQLLQNLYEMAVDMPLDMCFKGLKTIF